MDGFSSYWRLSFAEGLTSTVDFQAGPLSAKLLIRFRFIFKHHLPLTLPKAREFVARSTWI